MQIIRPDTWFCSNWNDCNFKARSAGEYSVNESSWDVWMELDSSFAVRTLRFTWFSCYRPKLMKARLQRWMWPCLRGALFWCNFRRLLKVANFWMILREVLSNTDELCPIFSISFYLSNGFCYFRCIFVMVSKSCRAGTIGGNLFPCRKSKHWYLRDLWMFQLLGRSH